MEDIRQKIMNQVEQLSYLESRREQNLQIIEKRVREINEKSRKAEQDNKKYFQ